MYTRWRGASRQPVWLHTSWSDPTVSGLFSFRTGGVSGSRWQSLNVGLHVGDQPSDVIANRHICASIIGGELEDWVTAQQVHGTGVHVARAADKGRGIHAAESAVPGVDALITDEPGLTLVVMAADCVPVLFYDPVHRAIGAAHSGWKGTVGHIVVEVVEAMKRTYGTKAIDLRVSLGPSIRQCCYEVDDVVRNPVVEAFGTRYVRPRFGVQGKFLLSLQSCIRSDLVDAGVPEGAVDDCGVCTSCQKHVLFSHRAESGRTGRQLGAVRLNTDGTL